MLCFVHMKNLNEIADMIELELNEKDELREKTLKQCRDILRESRRSIKAAHAQETERARKGIEKARELLLEIQDDAKGHPDILTAGYMENAMQELAEAAIFLSLIEDENMPAPDEIGVSSTAYLMGLADVVGELRRRGVYLLKDGNLDEVEEVLATMEDICDRLIEFDYPSGLLPIKRKQDVIRKVLEKMRGEIAFFKKSKEIENKIDALIAKLTKKKGDEEAVDIDSLL